MAYSARRAGKGRKEGDSRATGFDPTFDHVLMIPENVTESCHMSSNSLLFATFSVLFLLSRSKGKSKVLRSESVATYHGFSRSTHMTFRNPQTRCRTVSMGNFATMLGELLFFMNRIFSASSCLGLHKAKAMDEESPTRYESNMSSICQDGNLQGTALQHLAPKLRTRCIRWVKFYLGQKSKTTK